MLAEYASGFERTLNIAHRIVSTINHLLYYDADNQCYVNGYRPTIRIRPHDSKLSLPHDIKTRINEMKKN